MDEVARYNRARWKALAEADALFTRPNLELDPASARNLIDPARRFGEVSGKDVLCLASGGGQQSAAFAVLGARVTVFDLSKEQLERDRLAAEHYRKEMRLVEGDMRDLSSLDEASFDIVFHSYSLNFVPDVRQVFGQVARVMRRNGLYWTTCGNPFTLGMRQQEWNGEGYLLKKPYLNGAQITYEDQDWVYQDGDRPAAMPKPVEYRHTLSEMMNAMIDSGFQILHVTDDTDMSPEPDGEPGSWDHFVAFAPPWIGFLAAYRPDTTGLE